MSVANAIVIARNKHNAAATYHVRKKTSEAGLVKGDKGISPFVASQVVLTRAIG